MAIFFNSKEHTANKIHKCMACEWLMEAWNQADIDLLLPQEREVYEKAKANGFKIMPGDRYIRQEGIYDGEFATFKGLVEIDAICRKYELYPDPSEY